MRILIISNYFSPVEVGGWEQLTYDVSQHLRERGHQVLVLTSNYRAEEVNGTEPGVARLLHLESPDHVHYKPAHSLTHRRREDENKLILTQMVTDFGPDLIYINGMWNLPHSVASHAEYLYPGRVVYYMASYWPTETDAHTSYWLDMPVRSWRRLPKRLLATAVRKTLLSSTPRNQLNFTLVLCVSGFIQDYLVNEAGIPRERTRVVHNGIDINEFSERSRRADSPVLRLLYAGRLSPDKGVHTTIESLAYLRQHYSRLPIHLSVVGGGASEYQGYLHELVRKCNLADVVEFWGRVPREQMPAVMAEHEVLLFPSIWAEPLARTVQEGMACGLVVIGTTTGGTPEILIDGENGLTFAAEDAPVLAEKIALVASNRDLWSSLAQAARRTVEERFTLAHMIDELEGHFGQIIKRRELEHVIR